MRKVLVLLAFLPLSAGCIDLDLTGLGDAFASGWCGGGCGSPPPPQLSVTGSVRVGPYPALADETKLLLYEPSDTVTPTDSAWAYGSDYWVNFGSTFDPEVCRYVARAVLWSGQMTELKPLFRSSEPCEVSDRPHEGSDFDLPDYPALDDPFVVWGSVAVDGRAPTAGEVAVNVSLRSAGGDAWPELQVPTDDEGVFRYETTEGAQRYWLCVRAEASARRTDGGEWAYTQLGPTSDGECHDERHLPDIRIGTRKAASGWIYVSRSDPGRSPVGVGAGGARVALLDPADSTIVGEEVETYDDGSFHVWFPQDMQDPGCDWLLRAELVETGDVKVQALPATTTTCYPDLYLSFEFDE